MFESVYKWCLCEYGWTGCATSLCGSQRTTFAVGPCSPPPWWQLHVAHCCAHQCPGVPLCHPSPAVEALGLQIRVLSLALHGFWASEVRASLWPVLYHWDPVPAPHCSLLWQTTTLIQLLKSMYWINEMRDNSKQLIILQSFARGNHLVTVFVSQVHGQSGLNTVMCVQWEQLGRTWVRSKSKAAPKHSEHFNRPTTG